MLAFIKSKSLTLSLLFFSALGFSIALLAARFFGDKTIILNALNYQSTISLFGFLLQMGFRASLRMHIHMNRKRIAAIAEAHLIVILSLIAIISFFIEYIFQEVYFVVASCALAAITLKLTLSVARENKKKQFYFTLLNFMLCILAVCVYFLIENVGQANIVIEVLALIPLLVFSAIILRNVQIFSGGRRNLKVFSKLISSSQSFQLGSGVIFLMIYVITQTVIEQYAGLSEITLFADVQILSGAIVLVIGQLLLVAESKLYKDTKIRFKVYSVIVFIQILFVALIVVGVQILYNSSLVYIVTISLILTSRGSLGYVVQYVHRGRKYLNFVFAGLVSYLYIIISSFSNASIVYQLVPSLILLLAGFILLRSEGKNAKK